MEIVTNNIGKKSKLNESKNAYVWKKLHRFIDGYGEDGKIKHGMVILKTIDGDIRSVCINMNDDEIISDTEEFKFRHYINKHFNEGEKD